ncbi:BLUF domain-containing protein [Flammeovirga kamogawensis]|uniref:BLUF domain-containing protein n=1 Tax=Flammeovirga kamogawensis TaxID=373891 RepID=A0ABX8GZ23_9BACT|nr:BLUF domain-containing protein [Flammeovirga kamogawensis]MBB6459306.1 hypothetical protein [Flammeovirga kamogawensis]QWG08866.1 BLUF domain-containing protein [Flammeovirga kamogawensis]TRX67156.1 BLUF domain-containing protein [Flammeovirga kamogawensis]
MISSYIYSSKSEMSFDSKALHQLQALAQKENKKHNITGYLTYKNDHFIQYIEGPESAIEQLITNLKKDNRHQIVKSYALPIKGNRVFKSWNMRYIEYNDLVEIGFHELLETVFFTVNNKLFSDEEISNKIERMLNKISISLDNIVN